MNYAFVVDIKQVTMMMTKVIQLNHIVNGGLKGGHPGVILKINQKTGI
ncbi:hypothetical protein [Brevibacillus brevis]|nr:hypothetical protein [Brevibacillus brevis]WJQ83379.1 hypothetical protein QN310_09670 [Brevibacillus brevis]